MDMEKRAILAFILSLIILFVYQLYFYKTPDEPATSTKREEKDNSQKMISLPVEKSKKVVDHIKQEEKEFIIDSDLYNLSISSNGAYIKRFIIKRYMESIGNKIPINLVLPEALRYTPILLELIVGEKDSIKGCDFKSDIVSLRLQRNQESMVFKCELEQYNLSILKKFTFLPNDYLIGIDTEILNSGKEKREFKPSISISGKGVPLSEKEEGSSAGFIAYINNEVKRLSTKDLKSTETMSGEIRWAGIESKYFISSIIPIGVSDVSVKVKNEEKDIITTQVLYPKIILDTASKATYSFKVYLGPKEFDRLRSMKIRLEESIEYGWFWWLALPLVLILKFFYVYTNNYGIAIIILTVLIKAIFWPLTRKSFS